MAQELPEVSVREIRLRAHSVLLGLHSPFLCCSQAGGQPSQAGAVPSSSRLLAECLGKGTGRHTALAQDLASVQGSTSLEPLDAAAEGLSAKGRGNGHFLLH